MNPEKKPHPVDFHDASFDDVRTIPDFYDNLYPSNDSGDSVLLSMSVKPKRKYEKKRKSEKKSENSSEN